jgi:HEAT repeat protein
MNDALRRLAAFVGTGGGVMGARRNAIAYLGGTAGRGGDVVFEVVGAAFRSEKAAGLRRTAGDALSDLGDARAAPLATAALADRSTLVRWRAARILGEVGEGMAVAAALKQAQFDEGAFECAFEMKDAARKVALRNAGEDGAARGPMWKQIQDGMK